MSRHGPSRSPHVAVSACFAAWKPMPLADWPPDIEDWRGWATCRCHLEADHTGNHVCFCGGQVVPVASMDGEADEYLWHARSES